MRNPTSGAGPRTDAQRFAASGTWVQFDDNAYDKPQVEYERRARRTLGRRWSVAGARFHAAFAETAGKTFK